MKMKRAFDKNRFFLDIAGSLADTIAKDVGEITRKRRFRSLFGISMRICVLIWTLLSKQLGHEASKCSLCRRQQKDLQEVDMADAGGVGKAQPGKCYSVHCCGW
jgi:hypothetical protein